MNAHDFQREKTDVQRNHGQIGELAAARFLRRNGYTILSANYRIRGAEIDLIAEKDHIIAFCEVKTRSSDSPLQPREFVTLPQQRRIAAAALAYLQQTKMELQPRFDVLEVILRENDDQNSASVTHIPNAFEGDVYRAFV